MDLVKKYTYNQIKEMLNKKTVRFVSDCQFFPDFDVTGKVRYVDVASNGELMFHLKLLKSQKKIQIGYNMKNLKFEILQ